MLALFAVVAVIAAAGALFGLVTPKWRARPRNEYFRLPVVLTLIVAFAGSGAGLLSQGETTFGWIAVAAAGWVVLESLFAAWQSTQAAQKFFQGLAAEDAEEVPAEPAPALVPEHAPAPAPAPGPRRNPTPHGPRNTRRRR